MNVYLSPKGKKNKIKSSKFQLKPVNDACSECNCRIPSDGGALLPPQRIATPAFRVSITIDELGWTPAWIEPMACSLTRLVAFDPPPLSYSPTSLWVSPPSPLCAGFFYLLVSHHAIVIVCNHDCIDVWVPRLSIFLATCDFSGLQDVCRALRCRKAPGAGNGGSHPAQGH